MLSLRTYATAFLILATTVASQASYAASDFVVTLLGTASPAPRPGRMGPSTLVVVNGQKLLFDTGRGATIRLWQMRVPIGSLDATFMTHYHSDHTNGLPDVWLTGWLASPYGGRKGAFHIVGPTGLQRLMDGLWTAYQGDIEVRQADEDLKVENLKPDVKEFDKAGTVYEKNGVKVTAFENDHGDVIKPSYGYKIEYDGRSVVISGDTRYSRKVVEAAKGADILIHEVGAAKPALLAIPSFKKVIDHHTSPEDAGKVFTEAAPKIAVYTHIVLLSNKDNPEPTIEEVVDETRKTYGGPLVAGTDLMSFDVSKTGVGIINNNVPQ